MSDCIFCKIVAGELPSERIYEDDRVVAFMDAHPSAPIHVLIVPRDHIATFNDIPDGDDLLCHIGEAAKKIVKQLGVAESGYRFVINVNRGGGQVIFHLHAHIMAGADFGMKLITGAVALGIVVRKLKGWLFGGRKPRP